MWNKGMSLYQLLERFVQEDLQEEVTVVIGILYDLTMKSDLLHQKGYLKRGNLAQGKQVTFHETTIGFPQNDVSRMSRKIPYW